MSGALTDDDVKEWVKANTGKAVTIPSDAYYIYRGKAEPHDSAIRAGAGVVKGLATSGDGAHASVVQVDANGYIIADWYIRWPGMRQGWITVSFTIEPPNRYPHTCPRCKGPAYVGFTDVDCKKSCR